ncbi:sulfotransferase family protein [Acrocarpospora catenulata]|uniref:sulfotransferase family protein n=1 Tax=Acrocarpospora catenulata TaxID=2836182 RepID=UPI002023946C|nr:sulfotransferase [Acrocarpospora catenulata]
MLGRLDGVAAPPSVHKLKEFQKLLPRYTKHGELDRRDLAMDMTRLIDLNVLSWPEGAYSPRRIVDAMRHDSLAGAVIACYDCCTETLSREVWVNKCLENLYYFDQIVRASPTVKVIHIVRDPRDVALSFRKAPIGPKHPCIAGFNWKRDQVQAEALRQGHPEIHWSTIRYEDLVRYPHDTMRGLCQQLGLDFQESIFDFHRSSEALIASRLSPIWVNLAKPLSSSHVGAHTAASVRDFVKQVEEVTADLMTTYGYQPLYVGSAMSRPEEMLAEAEARNRELQNIHLRSLDPEVEKEHGRRLEFLAELKRLTPDH